MRKLYLLICALFCAMAINAQSTTILTENFYEGKPASAPSTATIVTLASGDWTFCGVSAAKDQSNYRAKMSGGGYFILPALDKPTSITFDHRASGGGKKLTVEKSTDGAATWSAVGEASPSSASAYGNAAMNISAVSGAPVWQRTGIAVEASAEYSIPVAETFTPGVYIVTLRVGNETAHYKLVF